MNVVVSKTAWQGFLRRAKRAHPLEHVEALYGLETVDTFRIAKFARIKLSEKDPNTSKEIGYTAKEVKRQKQLAKEAGLEFLGTVHTHPQVDHEHVPSEHDHIEAVKDGEKMMGIVHLYKPAGRKSHFVHTARWWFPQKPMAFTILPE